MHYSERIGRNKGSVGCALSILFVSAKQLYVQEEHSNCFTRDISDTIRNYLAFKDLKRKIFIFHSLYFPKFSTHAWVFSERNYIEYLNTLVISPSADINLKNSRYKFPILLWFIRIIEICQHKEVRRDSLSLNALRIEWEGQWISMSGFGWNIEQLQETNERETA